MEKKNEIRVRHIKSLLSLGNPSLNFENLRKFQVNFKCQIRLLWKLNLKLDEFYTVLL